MKKNRILLKISGEMLGGGEYGIDRNSTEDMAREIVLTYKNGYEMAVVIGGGNIFRGSQAAKLGMDRSSADYMGMLATVINGLALQTVLESQFGLVTRVMSALHINELVEPYIRRKAIKHLETGKIVIFVSGTGNPLFTTDTAAALRAREINANLLLKATKVDGVYDKDPVNNLDAKKYIKLRYLDVVSKSLKAMDATAITMCMEADLPICVFKMDKQGCVIDAIANKIGTMIYNC